MSLKDLEPGQYPATPHSWGVQEMENLEGKPLKAIIRFSLEDGTIVTWDDFFLTKNGTPNKKTFKTLKVCGFKGTKLYEFAGPNALDKSKTVDLTLAKNDKGYMTVEWVNEPGGGLPEFMEAKTAAKKLHNLKLDSALSSQEETPPQTKAKPAPKPNQRKSAPPPQEDDFPFDLENEEEIPF